MPGKTSGRDPAHWSAAAASMRPQRNAGENFASADIDGPPAFASMRPQRNAGENQIVSSTLRRLIKASMRPQRNAGENAIQSALRQPFPRLQ